MQSALGFLVYKRLLHRYDTLHVQTTHLAHKVPESR